MLLKNNLKRRYTSVLFYEQNTKNIPVFRERHVTLYGRQLGMIGHRLRKEQQQSLLFTLLLLVLTRASLGTNVL